jgi:hypothetical protein
MSELFFQKLRAKLNTYVHIAPLAVFRILFGAMMFAGTLRFAMKGWIYDLYIKPVFYFSYFGFEWVKPLSSTATYLLFLLLAISALFVMLGLLYRYAAVVFFITFTYIELIDKSNYLNHYYFVSLVSLLMIFLPAGSYFSLDVYLKPKRLITHIPRYFIVVLQVQLGIVYFFAGLAKLNYDWLVEAMPLRIWLQAHTDFPLIGFMMDKAETAYLFSWFGALYDLSIPFLLIFKRTRILAYVLVVVFHMMTYFLFQIGLFPYIMIVCTLIFFSEKFHLNVLAFIRKIINKIKPVKIEQQYLEYRIQNSLKTLVLCFFTLHFIVQLLFPFRFLAYPGKLFWTEQGYRFSWRVMLMEKAGKAFFYVVDSDTNQKEEVVVSDYLTMNQEKMMATQADMILQFAHYLADVYKSKGIKNPEVYVESYVSLNGSGSRLFIDKTVDLSKEKDSFSAKKWILNFSE